MAITDKLKAKVSKLVNFEIYNIQFEKALNSLCVNCSYSGEELSKTAIKLDKIFALNLSYDLGLGFSEETAFIASLSIDYIETEEDLFTAFDKTNYLFTNHCNNYKQILPLYLLRIEGGICINVLAEEIK